jgi:hypothetical protein
MHCPYTESNCPVMNTLDVGFAKTSAETQDGAILGGVGRRLSVQYSKMTLEGALTSPSFCTSFNERVYITAIGCEIGLGGTRGLQAAGAGGL